MIKEKVIQSPEISVLDQAPSDVLEEKTQVVVPSWIKFNAKSWSLGEITDSDFVEGIKYLIKEEIILFLVLTLILLFVSSVGIYYFENPVQPEKFSSIFSGLWWSIGTLTTVGYGDIYPITAGGKIFTFFVLMIGLGIVAVPTGLFASALTKSREL